MTRHEKQAERLQLRDRIHDAIVGLHYWPPEWRLNVELCQRVDAQMWFRRRRKRPGGGQRAFLNLRVRENWLESVFEPGLAVIDGHFILWLEARDCPVPGMDACFSVESAYFQGSSQEREYRLFNWCGYLCSYGGEWAADCSYAAVAANRLLEKFGRALTDPGPPF